jgi:hypothetical protein
LEKTPLSQAEEGLGQEKSGGILCLTLLSWGCLSVWSWSLFAATVPTAYGSVLATVLKLVHLPWMLFWLWGIHNFWHQTFSCFPRRRRQPMADSPADAEVAILYATCDDFDPTACHSCLNQHSSHARLLICDDSLDHFYKNLIDQWAAQFGPRVTIIRRANRRGFKAGNLNHAIAGFTHEEFLLLCDADEVIPADFVAKLLPYARHPDVAFAQARHCVRTPAATRFAHLLGHVTNIFFEYCLPLRNRFGFVSCFGHGVLIKRSVWEAIGGFPERASEDLAFASQALAAGYRGLYVEEVIAEEAFPSSYTALLKKYLRVVEGTIEYFRKDFPELVKSPLATWTEKVDLLITYSSCYLGLVAMINLVGGLILVYLYKLAGHTGLQVWLVIFYLVGPFTPIAPLIVNLPKEPKKYGKLFFLAAMAYASLLPMLGVRAAWQILRPSAPTFEPTGKIGRQKQLVREHALTVITGLFVFGVAVVLRSLAFVPAAGIGLMFMLGPALCLTERDNRLGTIARNCGFIPYALMIFLFLSWR